MMNVSKTGLMSRLSAGNGIQDVEGRVRAIEGRIQNLQKMTTEKTQPQFATFLSPQVNAESADQLKPSAAAFQPMIEELSARYGVDKTLINAVVRQESCFNPVALSHAGAQGLMQLMPATAKTLGVTDPYNPAQNLEGGVRHLSSLLAHYNGNIPLALAAYNAGMGAVKKHGGIPPYAETQNYVKSILAQYLRDKNATV